jgi:hypothetical protein
MAAFVRRLREHHALVIGNVTAQYPLMFRVDPLKGVNTAGETRFFFRGQEAVDQESGNRKSGIKKSGSKKSGVGSQR